MSTSLSVATFASGRDFCELSAAVDRRLNGVIVRRGIIGAHTLVVTRTEELEYRLFHSALGNPMITRDNSFIPESDLPTLDHDGIVRVGTVARGGATAVSVLRPVTASKKAKPGHRLVQNDSCEFPEELNGYTVTSVVRENILERPR